jgi:hypothetical protein
MALETHEDDAVCTKSALTATLLPISGFEASFTEGLCSSARC